MENIQKLQQLNSKLTSEINSFNKAIRAHTDGESIMIGIDYARVSLRQNKHILHCLESLKADAKNRLKPITERLKILDELAAETVK